MQNPACNPLNYYGNMSDDGIGTRFAAPRPFELMGGKRKSPSRVDAERACRARPKSDAEVVQPPPERKLLCVGEPDRASLAVVCADERVPDDAVVVE